ncbi:MAG: PA1571 family protein [Alcanivoracaceae bacterium]
MQTNSPNPTPPVQDFHGAALIDAQGREIPITEDMIRHAIVKLEHHWHYPATAVRQGRRADD